jgi:voltage-gated potassium channel
MVFVAFILLTVASSFVYIAEQEAKTKGFSSIPEAMWWGVVTLTTVGYGDVYPETFWGKILGAVIALLGVGMIALPAGILGSGFVDELRSKREAEKICPHCGKSIDDHKES